MNITNLDCTNYTETKRQINKNFYLLNAHGEELETNYEIPKGVRIIMFCYSGKILDICHKFDKFNWSHILLNPNTSSNYCSFLSAISKYSSIRDHFCIYEENDVIKNIMLYSDENFREGMFRLPVKGFAYDKNSESVVISSNTLMSEVIKDKRLKNLFKNNPKRIRIDDTRIVNLLRKNNDVGIINSFVRKIKDQISLSKLINSMKLRENEFTLLLMVCREGIGDYNISRGKKVIDEVNTMKRQIDLEKILS
jgi:hypothetical protein